MRARHFVPPLRRCVPLIGCAGGAHEPGAGDGPPPAAADIAYAEDPVTARIDGRAATHGRKAALKAHHAPALQKCRTPR
ncbi:hypothetical protein [Streptomyces sp. NPDC054961]